MSDHEVMYLRIPGESKARVQAYAARRGISDNAAAIELLDAAVIEIARDGQVPDIIDVYTESGRWLKPDGAARVIIAMKAGDGGRDSFSPDMPGQNGSSGAVVVGTYLSRSESTEEHTGLRVLAPNPGGRIGSAIGHTVPADAVGRSIPLKVDEGGPAF